jgi:hypothetical protein
MKLITELTEQISYLSEAKESGGKEHFIEGIFETISSLNGL